MRFQVLLAFAVLYGAFAEELRIQTGAPRSVADIASAFERLMGNQPKAKVSPPASPPSTPTGTPKTIDQLKYPLETPAAPSNSKDAEIWKLLQEKQAKLKKVKQEMLNLIEKRNDLLIKQNNSKKGPVIDPVQKAIIRAIDMNLAYVPKHL